MSKASAELLELIHASMAQAMLDKLNSEEGADARDWAVMVKFLKDNHIDAVATSDTDAADAFANLVAEAHKSFPKFQ